MQGYDAEHRIQDYPGGKKILVPMFYVGTFCERSALERELHGVWDEQQNGTRSVGVGIRRGASYPGLLDGEKRILVPMFYVGTFCERSALESELHGVWEGTS